MRTLLFFLFCVPYIGLTELNIYNDNSKLDSSKLDSFKLDSSKLDNFKQVAINPDHNKNLILLSEVKAEIFDLLTINCTNPNNNSYCKSVKTIVCNNIGSNSLGETIWNCKFNNRLDIRYNYTINCKKYEHDNQYIYKGSCYIDIYFHVKDMTGFEFFYFLVSCFVVWLCIELYSCSDLCDMYLLYLILGINKNNHYNDRYGKTRYY